MPMTLECVLLDIYERHLKIPLRYFKFLATDLHYKALLDVNWNKIECMKYWIFRFQNRYKVGTLAFYKNACNLLHWFRFMDLFMLLSSVTGSFVGKFKGHQFLFYSFYQNLHKFFLYLSWHLRFISSCFVDLLTDPFVAALTQATMFYRLISLFIY